MTLDRDQDPGWWRRAMSTRALVVVVSIATLFIVIAVVVMILNGIPFV